MSEWPPSQLGTAEGHDYLANLLVLSTPAGLASHWEDEEPSEAVRSEVSEFARRMSREDFARATPLDRRDLPPHLWELIDQREMAGLRGEESAGADRPRPTRPDEKFDRVVFLRLKVRAATAVQKAAGVGERVIDFEFGPMGAPPEYPRVSINELFRHAAETA